MAFVEIQTNRGTQKVRVCDYCKCVCIPSGRFCSGFCARGYDEQRLMEIKHNLEVPDPPSTQGRNKQ